MTERLHLRTLIACLEQAKPNGSTAKHCQFLVIIQIPRAVSSLEQINQLISIDVQSLPQHIF